MEYIRRRRLTEAAQALAKGAPDILALALEAGYGSHEAFSRAFRAEFAATPETVRRDASTDGLRLVGPALLAERRDSALAPPRFETAAAILVVGLSRRTSFGATQAIAAQWQTFMRSYEDIAHKARPIPVGVSTNVDEDGNFEYVCGVEVARFAGTPRGLIELRIPAQTYAVFCHRGHVSAIRDTYLAIWNTWLPDSGSIAADAAGLERHMETFNPQTGLGGVEIWIPVKG
jgi:AraC family transcriptional regulator